MRYARITLTVALALAMTFGAAFAQTAPTLYSGSQINAIMDDQLDSGTTQAGDTFTMHVVAPYPSDDDTATTLSTWPVAARMPNSSSASIV